MRSLPGTQSHYSHSNIGLRLHTTYRIYIDIEMSSTDLITVHPLQSNVYQQQGAPQPIPCTPNEYIQMPIDVTYTPSTSHTISCNIPWNIPSQIVPGKVYFLPGLETVPLSSIVHTQKKQAGFFRHPVLVVNVDDTHAWFYALTSRLPTAISDLGMFLQLGRTSVDEGPGILRLEEISGPMQSVTYVNLEQRFKIEKPYLRTWAADVTIAEGELFKVQVKVDWLEAQQYRFIYKPLDRDLSGVLPGTVLMMPNAAGASTLGAPVLIVRNEYPLMEYLRIKLVKDHASLNKSSSLSPSDLDFRRRCLAIAPRGNIDHDETPIMELEPESPNMREPSYVDIHRNVKRGRLDRCKTWCFPPVKVCPQSVEMLKAYMAQLETHPPAPQPPLPHKSNGHIPGNWQGHFRGPPTSIKNAPTQVYGSRHRQDSIMGPSMPITTGHENRVEHFSLSALPTPNTIWHDPMYGHSHASGYNARPPLGYRAPLQSININLNARTYNYNMSYHVINDYSPGHGYGNGYGYEYNNAHYHVTPAPVRNVQHFSPSGPSCYSPSHVNEDIKENIASHLQQSYMPNEGAISWPTQQYW